MTAMVGVARQPKCCTGCSASILELFTSVSCSVVTTLYTLHSEGAIASVSPESFSFWFAETGPGPALIDLTGAGVPRKQTACASASASAVCPHTSVGRRHVRILSRARLLGVVFLAPLRARRPVPRRRVCRARCRGELQHDLAGVPSVGCLRGHGVGAVQAGPGALDEEASRAGRRGFGREHRLVLMSRRGR